ncbi:hypothetical protein QA596_10500 [Balneolales bacterium ANBcel1]|nr:hypothetical protein [Balneolales bacterium ANBcel1]
MDILKIIFEHDMTLEHLSGNSDPRNSNREATLESFFHPQQTYNRYYFTGTRLPEQRFGFNALHAFPELLERLDQLITPRKPRDPAHFGNITHDTGRTAPGATSGDSVKPGSIPNPNAVQNADKSPDMSSTAQHAAGSPATGTSPGSGSGYTQNDWYWHHTNGTRYSSLSQAFQNLKPAEVLVGGTHHPDKQAMAAMEADPQTGLRERFKPLTHLLDNDHPVFIAEKAHHGTDLHLFSRHNLYEPIFNTFRDATGPGLRYFSINGKRVSGERHFYFETWTLNRPPHGFQEVTKEARLR